MIRVLALAFIMLALPAAHADVLLIDAIAEEPQNTPGGLMRPSRGMTMATVASKYGEPDQRVSAVGVPPISRWIYPGFTVYFEHDLVLDTVVHR